MALKGFVSIDIIASELSDDIFASDSRGVVKGLPMRSDLANHLSAPKQSPAGMNWVSPFSKFQFINSLTLNLCQVMSLKFFDNKVIEVKSQFSIV